MKTKHFFVCLVILFVAFLANSQNTAPNYATQIDSLRVLIKAQTKDNKEKVRLLNEFARLSIFNLDYKEGLIAARDARELSKKLEFKGGEIMYYHTLSSLHGSGGMFNYQEKRAQWLSLESNDLMPYYNPVNIPNHYLGNDYNLQLEKLLSALSYFENLGDLEIQANLSELLSGRYYILRNLTKTNNTIDKTIKLYKDLGQLYPVFNNTTFKMLILTRIGNDNDEEVNNILEELTELISKNKNDKTIGLLSNSMGDAHRINGKYGLAVEYYLKCIAVFEKSGDLKMLAGTYESLGNAYDNLEMYDKSTGIYYKYIPLVEELYNGEAIMYAAYNKIAQPLYYLKRYDEALKYANLALQGETNQDYYKARKNSLEGSIRRDMKQYPKAIEFYLKAFDGYRLLNRTNNLPFIAMFIAECYQKMGDFNKALEYALQSLQLESETNLPRTKVTKKLSLMIAEIYEGLGNQQKAYDYLKMHQEIRSEIDKLDEINRIADSVIQAIIDRSQHEINVLEEEQLRKNQENKTQRLWIFSITGALLSTLLILFILYKNNKSKQKANALLNKQKDEIQNTLEQLKSTQAQLIQSEKMASLGELTAGIAHEIQNPLNFVNNFSEVSNELIDEMKEEIDSGNYDEVKEIADDVKLNLEKINHHGKRADGIVKGMLQHSRTSNGIKEPTNINTLTDEYLRLAYHGLRAKDKSFNATLETDYDASVGIINIIPQDIGRVILNLITNAFYAINDKNIQLKNSSADNTYTPTVWVSTKTVNDNVMISVKDNGNGIPQSVLDKIFQPFFTTKPTGAGTGLGLSMSYDIVKAHSGELKVNTAEGKGTTFTIQLPLKVREK